MAGFSIRFELVDTDAAARLQEMLSRMDERRPLFSAIGDMILRSTAENFRKQRSPDGTPWTPLRPKTVKQRQRRKQLPLTILRSNTRGRAGSALAGSINHRATDDELRVGTPVVYGAIHQFGGTIDRPARAAKIYRMKNADGSPGRRFAKKAKADHVTDVTIPAHKITVPARPYIGISAGDQAQIEELARDWLTR